ncbi:MAG: ABC transporter ATP-binding protein [Desulfobacteraceae bacterium]|nr:ABC transporter ATP-binding protein [Desulfobacteraceae bacterium]
MKISINNLSFSYDADSILRQLNCSFESGNFYAILGPNGSGKTTLLDLIAGFLKPCQGDIFFDKQKIDLLTKKQTAKKIGLVSQNYYINFPFTVQEVVMMGRHPHIPRFSHPSADDINLSESVMEKTGILHLAHRRVTELSGGEKQRCIFARALCQDTPVLLLDEAFSNMDISHTLQMLRLVRQKVIEKNLLVLSVFHDLNLASAWCDALVFLKKGQIKAFGKTSEVMTDTNIKTVFAVEAKVEFNEHVQAKQAYFNVS